MFLNRTLIAQQIKENINKWDCIKLKSFSTAKKTATALQNGRKSLQAVHLTSN
jgi:hypothetical protein